MRFGGLLEYDTQGVVRTVRAIVEHQTMDMVEFGEPETLMSQDVDRWGFITILYILHIPLLILTRLMHASCAGCMRESGGYQLGQSRRELQVPSS